MINLGFTVKGDPMNKKKGDEAIVFFKERDQLLKTLSMSYYANQLGVYFNAECILAHSVNYLRKTSAPDKRLSITKVIEMAKFIEQIFRNEFLSSVDERRDLDSKFRQYLQQGIK